MSDPYSPEIARLRSQVQEQLRQGVEPCLLPYEQLLLLGWYEREMARLAVEARALAGTVDRNYAERLQAERGHLRAVEALDRSTTAPFREPAGWDERTAAPLDGAEPPP